MNHIQTGEETVFADCLTCNQIKEEAGPTESSVCETCGDDYFTTASRTL